jgi:uncharacterized DUF497 family protein
MDIPNRLGIPDYEFRVVFGRTKIDYDISKEELNRKKHGYSLESAVHLLRRIILPLGGEPPHIVSDAFIENGEVRHNHLTLDDSGEVVLMVTTMRPDETVRIISFRRANKNEIKTYQENLPH